MNTKQKLAVAWLVLVGVIIMIALVWVAGLEAVLIGFGIIVVGFFLIGTTFYSIDVVNNYLHHKREVAKYESLRRSTRLTDSEH